MTGGDTSCAGYEFQILFHGILASCGDTPPRGGKFSLRSEIGGRDEFGSCKKLVGQGLCLEAGVQKMLQRPCFIVSVWN